MVKSSNLLEGSKVSVMCIEFRQLSGYRYFIVLFDNILAISDNVVMGACPGCLGGSMTMKLSELKP